MMTVELKDWRTPYCVIYRTLTILLIEKFGDKV
jgi:hypothetical protein